MSLLLDALRRSQNKAQAQAQGAPVEPVALTQPEVQAEPDFPTTFSPSASTDASPEPAALELTLDPIEPSPPPAAPFPALQPAGVPDLPDLSAPPAPPEAPLPVELAVRVDDTLSLRASEPVAQPEAPVVVHEPPPAPTPLEPAAVAPALAAPASAPIAPAVAPAATERIDVVRPRPVATAQETAQAMFNAVGASVPVPPTGRDGARARRLLWSLVIGLALAVMTWMGWQHWLSTQSPGLTPVATPPVTPAAIQEEAPVAPPTEGAASQALVSGPQEAGTSAPASASKASPAASPSMAPLPALPGASPRRVATPAREGAKVATPSSRAASSAAAVSKPAVEGVKPAQLVRSQAQQQLQSAWSALKEGDAARAQALYQQVLAARPNDPDAVLGLAVSLHRQRQLQAAWDAYQRSLQVWPDNETARTGMLAILSESDPDTAESRLQEWVQSRPRDAATQAALGNLLGKQGRWAQALGPLTLAQSLAPNSAPHAYNLAVALDQARRYDEALQMYRRTLQLGAAGVPRQGLERRIQELQGALAR